MSAPSPEDQKPSSLRELDARIAQKVMGWANVEADCYTPIGKDWCGDDPEGTGGFYRTGRKIVRRYSTDIAAAMEVVEKLRERGMQVSMRSWEGAVPWSVKFISYRSKQEVEEDGDSLPEAICRAAAALSLVDSPETKEEEK